MKSRESRAAAGKILEIGIVNRPANQAVQLGIGHYDRRQHAGRCGAGTGGIDLQRRIGNGNVA